MDENPSEDYYNSESEMDEEVDYNRNIQRILHQHRIEKAELFNTELVKAADPAKISSAVSQQISLLGSRKLYERINNNLKIAKFEAHFAKVNLPGARFPGY